MRMDPNPCPKALQYTENGFSMFGITKTGVVVSHFFNSWKLALHLADHSNFLSFPSNSVIGLEILENPLMNLL
jgi:hypothetical protein